MEQALPQLFIGVIVSALVALIGKNREIGFGWSFVLCLFLTPLIGLIIILFSKKKDKVEFIDVPKNKDDKEQE